jgi:hypothetical protein
MIKKGAGLSNAAVAPGQLRDKPVLRPSVGRPINKTAKSRPLCRPRREAAVQLSIAPPPRPALDVERGPAQLSCSTHPSLASMQRQAAGEPQQRPYSAILERYAKATAHLPCVTSGIKVKALRSADKIRGRPNHEKITCPPHRGLHRYHSFSRHRARAGHRYPA